MIEHEKLEGVPAEDLHAWLRSRRSVRRFRPEPVDPRVLTRMLETAGHAPSAHNRQPWRFAVLDGMSPKLRLSQVMSVRYRLDLAADGLAEVEIEKLVARSRERLLQAPVVVVLCMDESEMDHYPDEKRQLAEHLMAVQSTALAGLQLQLAAHAEGLGAVWVCAPLFAPAAVSQELGLPETWQPQAMIFVGYPEGSAKPKPIKPLGEFVRWL